jgi:NADPH:quinone reductase-like Zn-dependent oxidoreductase
MQTLLIDKAQLGVARVIEESTPAPIATGQVRLKIDLFALTANNMTYAAFGQAMRYWDFYPHSDGGIVPVWGFAQIVESQHSALSEGQRFYGYYPMASEVVLTPNQCSERGFSVAGGARAELAAVYNQYVNVASDPFYKVNTEGLQAVLRPLFATSWLLADFFQDSGFFGAQTVLCSSASSKTAYAMAQLVKQSGQAQVVGLTATANIDFCRGLGCYDQVLAYDDLGALPADLHCVYVDFAGNAALRQRVHQRFSKLAYSCSVGGTHHDELGSGSGLPGPRPILFFAPAQMKKRQTDWGSAVFGQKLVADWQQFSTLVSAGPNPWIEVVQQTGASAVLVAWQNLSGSAGQQDSPRLGKVFAF